MIKNIAVLLFMCLLMASTNSNKEFYVANYGEEGIDSLTIEDPELPTLQIRNVRQEHAILCAGRPERLRASVRNIGAETENVVVRLELPPGVRSLGTTVHRLGAMPMGAEQVIEWFVQADTATIGVADIRITSVQSSPVTERHSLVFFSSEDAPLTSVVESFTQPPSGKKKGVTYYVDNVDGSNANLGTSPTAAWKDFSNINGQTLGPGHRLLIRRGSIINQELIVSARGTVDHWAQIGAYGKGPRPIIRRNWDIDDRCVLVRNPDFLRISSLVVCHAAKGLIVTYSEPGHQGLVIEDCIAHHIEGLYRPNANGIPEWRDRQGPTEDRVRMSAGFAIGGTTAKNLVFRNCESFQCSSGYYVRGDNVIIDRIYCHDNYVYNTSPHPYLVGLRRAVLQNSIFDAAGWHASAGTMGVMLGNPQGFIIRNCVFQNQPDSDSHDEGAIDFENNGNGCLIDHCTFENNAGASIEVLGLRVPQTTNIEIRNSRFIKNNTAIKSGPSEIYVWGKIPDPDVCISSGTIHDNGYVTVPGVEFFVNQVPKLTDWTLRNNTQYVTVEEIEKAMPFNRPPVLNAGADIRSDHRNIVLAGNVTDDQMPAEKPLSITWEVLEGAGDVVFEDDSALCTTATFSEAGDYILRLVADDGEFWLSDMVAVHILPAGSSVATSWEFNTPLDKEGWTEVNLGTRVQRWSDPTWPTTSRPVKYVAGGFYIVAMEKSSDAQLLSPDSLGIELTGKETITIRYQNHTPETQVRLRFTTDADTSWDDAKSRSFTVVDEDNGCRTYSVDMSAVEAWEGRLKQLRLDLATGKPVTGTCRFDYVWITRPGG